MQYRSLFTVICFLTTSIVFSQRFNYSFEQYTTDNGLSNDQVTTITKDKDGFLWIGTISGLNRFDGLSFKIFTRIPGNTQSIPGNYIAGTILDKRGFLWVSTNEGLCRLDTRMLKFDQVNLNEAGDSTARFNVMYGEFDHDGIGWFLANNYLYAINQVTLKWKRYRLPTEVYHSNLVQIDSKNRIWISLGRAKYYFDRKTENFTYLLGYDNEHRNTNLLAGVVKESPDGKLWMNTWDSGFFTWNEEKKQFERFEQVNESITTFVFDKDEQGRTFLWCGGGPYGLLTLDLDEKKFYQFKNDPRNKYTHNLGQATFIYKDSAAGIVWIGTENGLEKFDQYAIRFKRYRIWQDKNEYDNSQYFFTSGFVQDKTDSTGKTWWVSVWIGGLYKWSRDKTKLDEDYRQINGIKDYGIFSMLQASDGMIWIGHGLGVQVLNPRTEKFVKHYVDFFPDQKKRKIVSSIVEDIHSNMWFTTYQGVYSWDRSGDSIINWNKRIPALGGFIASNIRCDKKGLIWISTNKGLLKLNAEKGLLTLFDNSKRKRKLPVESMGAMLIDHEQHIWIGGEGYIAELDMNGEVLHLYDDKNGYQANSVYTFLEDQQHFIWIATENKIHRLNPGDGHFDYFDKNDGLFSNKAADGFYLSKVGELFVGFNGAFNSINTGKIPFNKIPPKVVASRLLVQGKMVNFDEENSITIRPGERNIVLEFAALNYSQSNRNRYGFIMEGYDTAWKYSKDRMLTLMNLEGGTHKLHVKASNNDGVWSKESVYTLKVIPPFQKTIWFKMVIVGVAGLLFWLIMYYRKQQGKKLEKIRNRIATDLHDDMGSTLSSIRIFSDVAKKQIKEKAETVQLLDRISNNATSLSENMQDIIWTIRSDNDSLEDLVSRMREFGLRVCDAKHIRFNIHVSQNFKASKLTLEQRRNLYLIFKEALNNAVKYAEPTQIDLILNLKRRFLKMEISDNGSGFDVEKVKRGNGLNNLQKRAAEIGSEIQIKSATNMGTNISMIVILNKQLLRNN